MVSDDDLNALLGINTSDIVHQAQSKKQEIAVVSDSNLKDKIIKINLTFVV